MEVKDIAMTSVNVSSFNTRKDLRAGTEDAGLDELTNSIREKGLLNPIIVRPKGSNTYDLIAGQRRYLACQRLGWTTIPAIIREGTDDTDATIISLVENVHRADMSPMDKARAYQRILEKYNDHNRIAKETGISVPTIKKYLTLLDLAPSIQDRLTTSEGPAGISTLSKLAETFGSPREQEEALEAIGGFKQSVQLEIIKQSGGRIDDIWRLKEKAMEGAFDVRACRGIEKCSLIPKSIRQHVLKLIEKSDREDLKTTLPEKPSMNKEERLETFRTSLTMLLEAGEGSFIVFEAHERVVQFAGCKDGRGFIIDIPIAELSKDEKRQLLTLKEFSSGEDSSYVIVSYQAEYDREDLEKAAQLTERIFCEIFGLPSDYGVKVELCLDNNT